MQSTAYVAFFFFLSSKEEDYIKKKQELCTIVLIKIELVCF